MKRSASSISRGIIATLFMLVACLAISKAVTANQVDQPQKISSIPAAGSRDQVYARVAQVVPGFGGMFNENGEVKIYLKGAGQLSATQRKSRKSAAIRALIDILGKEEVFFETPAEDLTTPSYNDLVRVLPAQYDYLQLTAWYDAIDPVLGVDNVVLVDLDASKNRLVVGVEKGTSTTGVEQKLKELKIPRKAIIFEEVGAIQGLSSD